MNKKIAIAIVAIVGIITLGIFSQRSQLTNTRTITSDDGSLKLKIPLPALPKGVNVESVKISRVPQEKDNGEALVYRLSPDGLSLSEPANAEITLSQDIGDSIPIVLHNSDKEILPLENVSILRDNAKKQAIVTFKLSHFSSLTVMLGMFRLGISSPGLAFVGEPFKVSTNTNRTGKTLSFDLSDGTSSTQTIVEPWTVEGLVEVSKIWQDIIAPQGVLDTPPYTKVQGPNQEVNALAQFTCIKPERSVYLTYKATIAGETKSIFKYSLEKAKLLGVEGFTSIKPFKEEISVFSELFECKDRATKPSLTPKTDTSNKSTSGNLVPVDVLVINNKFFAASQFSETGAEAGCQARHYHTKYEVSNIDLDTHLFDPNPGGCGFGTVDSVPRRTEMVTKEKAYLFK